MHGVSTAPIQSTYSRAMVLPNNRHDNDKLEITDIMILPTPVAICVPGPLVDATRDEGEEVTTKHFKCQKVCGRRYGTCNHKCPKTCHQGDCGPCSRPCEVRCPHSKCNLQCSQPCAPCIEKCAWHCEHQGKCNMPCAAPCERLPYNVRCTKSLKCGH